MTARAEPGHTNERVVQIAGKRLTLTHLDKVLYPSVGFTKGDAIDYYQRIAPGMLPHLKNRPVSLKRYPDGVERSFFWDKACPAHRPSWVRTAPVWSPTNGRNLDFCLINSLPTMIWTTNLAALELHTTLALAADLDRPTALVFDLDPGPPADILACARVGLWFRDLLGELGLQSFAKTSGSKGLHVSVPLNTPVTYEQTKPFAHALALGLERRHPELVVSRMQRSLRDGKVLIDWSQNDGRKTTVCAYSLRGHSRPTVSTPVGWQEVEAALRGEDRSLLVFEAEGVLERVEQQGELFAPVLKLKQRLPKLPESEVA